MDAVLGLAPVTKEQKPASNNKPLEEDKEGLMCAHRTSGGG